MQPGQAGLRLDAKMSRMPVPPRIELALLPTPILKLERLSRRLGVELYVKRDDLTGLLEAGGQVRKLEFLAGEALAQGADTLITCGGPQSDMGRAVAAVAARLGCRAVVVVDGRLGGGDDGNLLLQRMLGAGVRDLAGRAETTALEEIAGEVRARGGRPYVIPEDGADEVGALGYLEGAVELAEQINHGAPRFDTVVIAARSGTSHAGLLMGKYLSGLPSDILGVPVADPADVVRGRIAALIAAAVRRFGFAIDVPKAIHLLDGYQIAGRRGGPGRGLAGPAGHRPRRGPASRPDGYHQGLPRPPRHAGPGPEGLGGARVLRAHRDAVQALPAPRATERAAGAGGDYSERVGLALLERVNAGGVDLGELFCRLLEDLRLDVVDPDRQVGGHLVDLPSGASRA